MNSYVFYWIQSQLNRSEDKIEKTNLNVFNLLPDFNVCAVVLTAEVSFVLQVVQEYERVIIFRLGRPVGRRAKGPGTINVLLVTGDSFILLNSCFIALFATTVSSSVFFKVISVQNVLLCYSLTVEGLFDLNSSDSPCRAVLVHPLAGRYPESRHEDGFLSSWATRGERLLCHEWIPSGS